MKYSAAMTHKVFAFVESKKMAELMVSGLEKEDIFRRIEEENIFSLRDASRLKNTISYVYERLNALPGEALEIIASSDIEVGKLLLLIGIMKTDSVTGSGKRPIYWLFDSGKENGFKALIYMHRYTPDTVGIVRTEYLHKIQKAIEQAMQRAEYTRDNASSASDKKKAVQQITKYTKQLAQMKSNDEAMAHIANQRIDIDLDDGVKVNYAKFQGVEVAREGKKALKIDLLAKIK